MNELGKKIAAARKQKGITPKQLAKKCGVSEPFIADMEAGRKIVNETLLKRLAKVLEVNFDIGLGEIAENEPIEDRKIILAARETTKTPNIQPLEQWDLAFGNVLRKVPVHDLQTWEIKDYRLQPVVSNKIDGFAPDKVIFVAVGGNTLNGIGIKQGDYLKVALNREFIRSGVYLINYGDKHVIRRITKLDGDKLLLADFERDPKTDIRNSKEVEILGRCISAEITL